MNHPVIRPVLGVACLASLSVVTASALEVEQAIPDDLQVGVGLESKQYDQGIIRNDEVTLHERFSGRWLDIGFTLDGWQAIGEDNRLPKHTTRGNVPEKAVIAQTTQINARLDYLIEMKDYFQILPFIEWINYPNLRDVPLKDNQWNFGLDAWYMTPVQGVEVGGSFSYNPFYDVKEDSMGAGGWSSHHLLRGCFGAREFLQYAPFDIMLWQVFNYGNENYNRMVGYGNNLAPAFAADKWKTGFNLLDLGAQVLQPLPWKDWWMTARVEGHFWLERYARNIISDAGMNSKEYIIAVGVRWWPTAESKKD
jgi:hypothetical protein